MSNFIVPNTFVPGTKAKAQEVNENFIAVQDELNKKIEKEGDSTKPFIVGEATEDYHAITKGQVDNYIAATKTFLESEMNSFMVKSGNVDSDGEADILAYENGVLSFKVDDGTSYAPIVAVPANLQLEFTITSLDSIDLSSYPNGTYNVFIKSNETAYVLLNSFLVQKARPESPSLNCIFADVSKTPITAEIYNGSEWEEFNDVYIGNVTVANGAITSVKNIKFNDNGYNVNRFDNPVVISAYKNGLSWYRIWSDGWCEQGGRGSGTKNTTYTVVLPISYQTNYYSVTITTNVTGLTAGTAGAFALIAALQDRFTVGASTYSDPKLSTYYWVTKGYLDKN